MNTSVVLKPSLGREVRILLAPVAVAAGWPSPAQDYYDGDLDLNEHLIPHPDTTYIVRVSGDSMIGAGIAHGDELIVEKDREAKVDDIVIAIIAGELTVKRLTHEKSGAVVLKSENKNYPDIRIPPLGVLEIWGVVKACIHYV